MNAYKPDYHIHPYEYLKEILETREINKKDFFDFMGVTEKQIEDIETYSFDFILKLADFFYVDREIWINLVENFVK